MFCARCGQQIADNSKLCPLCGRETELRLPDPPVVSSPGVAVAATPATYPATQVSPAIPIRRPDLKGVGGWLLFFCVSLTVLAPVVILARVTSVSLNEGNAIDLGLAALGLVVGGFVWNVHRLSFVLLWFFFGAHAVVLVLAFIGLATSRATIEPQEITTTIRALLSTALWFWYFKKSDRVQATFGRNL